MKTGAGTKNITFYRVIYGDTDQMGVAYYANYLRWFEKGRSEFLRQIGLPYAQIERRGYYFPVTEVSCRYFKSVRYDDVITIATQLKSCGRAVLHFEYRISMESETASLALGWTKHACVNAEGRITRIPEAFARLLSQALAPPS